MAEVIEFKDVFELNKYLDAHRMDRQWEVKPVARMFQHPQSKQWVNTITYVLIIGW